MSIRAAPSRVELAMIGAIDIQLGLEPRTIAVEFYALPLLASHETRNIGVVSAMDDQVTDVLYHPPLARRFVLAFDRGDGHYGFDWIVIIEAHGGVVGIMFHVVEQCGRGRRFTAAFTLISLARFRWEEA